MGDDGAATAARKTAGGRTVAAAESSAVVFGMPDELIRLDGAAPTRPARSMPGQTVGWLS